ncbi:MAG TPA: proton-conducting transporter membrane subunit [Acidimicrobiales bacterium]|nr:proton-conducting transporter membrane subunit [Acidimicrobiales bacterium]
MPVLSGSAALPPLAVAVPILGACLLIALIRLPRPVRDTVAVMGAGATVGLDAALLAEAAASGRVATWSGGWLPVHDASVGVVLVVDSLNAGLALLAASLVTMALVYSWRYFSDADARYQPLMLCFLAGMEGFALTGDVFDMFVFFELMAAAAYALTGLKNEDPTGVQGALNFAIVNSFGAYLSLMGVGILYAHTGLLGMPQLYESLRHQHATAVVIVSFGLLCTGLLIKAAVAPFHFWTADAEAVAPAPVCAVFSGVMVVMGLYGVDRLYWDVFSPALAAHGVRPVLLTFGVATAAIGALMCVTQRHLKRLLAYATIGHVGLFLMGLATLHADGTAGAAVYVCGDAGVEGALFLLVGVILSRHGTVDEAELYGKERSAPVLAGVFLLAGLALAGLPPFGVALGKALAEDAVSKAGYAWAPAVYIGVSALTGGAVLRAGGRVYFGLGARPDAGGESSRGRQGAESDRGVPRTPAPMMLAIGLLLAGGLAVGLIPGLAESVAHATERMIDPAGYSAGALRGVPSARPAAVPGMGWSGKGIGTDVASALLAVGVVAAGLYGRAAAPSRWLFRAVARAFRPVRRAHSGHVGDYLAWVVSGSGLFLGALALALR